MIRPTEIPEEQHAPRCPVEAELERVFDACIRFAADNRAWPAKVFWLPWIGPNPSQVSILNVADRYSTVGWHVVLDHPDRSILATIRRR